MVPKIGQYVQRVTPNIIELKVVAPIFKDTIVNKNRVEISIQVAVGRYIHYHYYDVKKNLRSIEKIEGVENNPPVKKMSRAEIWSAERLETWYKPEPEDNLEPDFEDQPTEAQIIQPQVAVLDKPKSEPVKPVEERKKRKSRLVIKTDDDVPKDETKDAGGGVLDFF